MKKSIGSNLFDNLVYNNKLLKSYLFDLRKYSFFLKKYNYYFSFYNTKFFFRELKRLVFILKYIKSKGGVILFIGLTEKEYPDFIFFNNSLRKLVISEGHLYADSNFKSFLYNRWSHYKRRSNPSDYFLNLQENKKYPNILFSFSRKTNDVIFKEFSKFGLPILYMLEDSGSFRYKDYPLIGTYSEEMLSFYFTILKYGLKNV